MAAVTGSMMRQEFTGTLADRDLKTHVAHEAVLPNGAASVSVHLEYVRGPGLGHLLCLSLFDACGFRGSGHRDGVVHGGEVVHEVRISPETATPGYHAGPVPAGFLRVVIHVHRIVAGEACPYRLTVEWSEAPVKGARTRRAATPHPAAPPRAVRTPAWYRGDLHAHTEHSDGEWDIAAFLSFARKAGFDFVALTDHNTTSQLSGIDDGEGGKPLVIPGMELTTFSGHAVSLGTRAWIDWGVLRRDGMSAICRDVRRGGGLFVIAHPASVGDPVCSGCDWRFSDMMPGPVSAVEVWNGPWDCNSNNEQGLALWYEWLEAGHRVVATGGSDTHGPGECWERIGRSVVWSQGCTEEAILGSIAAGHLYLSAGPRLELSAVGGGRVAMMGETLSAESAELQIRWEGSPSGAVIRLVGDGVVLSEERAAGDGTRRWEGVAARWCVAELRDRVGQMLALTNPVYLEPREPRA